MLLRVILYRLRDTPIGIALTKYRINGTAEHLRVGVTNLLFGVVGGFFRIIRNGKALRL